MPGRSVVYVFARDRPIDMMPPIWPCARRCIQTKKPMSSTIGSSSGSSVAQMLALGRLELDLDAVLGEAAARSASEGPAATGPWCVNFVAVGELAGDVAVVVVPLDALDVVVAATCRRGTASTGSRCPRDVLNSDCGSRKAAATSPSSTQIDQRGQPDMPMRPPDGPAGRGAGAAAAEAGCGLIGPTC